MVVTTLSYALINSATARADGEKWTLTEKTTIKVTGGALGGTAVTLKPNSGDGRADPSVWTETGSKSAFFTSGTDKICVRVNGLVDIDNNRSKTGSIDLVDPGWCSDPIAPGGGGIRGPTGSTGLSTKATLTSTIATTPLKCGDAGFMGPCAEPFDPATTDCSTVANTADRTRCESIQTCIIDRGATPEACTSGWDACIATYADADEGAKGASIPNCAEAIKAANFEGGKYTDPGPDEDASSCKVEGIGWIICPVMNFMGMITDGSYTVVETMLKTPVSMFDTSKSEGQMTQAVWSTMRNIANALFVIAFIVIIYSQLTSTGITNYGVKKMLPKLIVSAILVNLSFIVCALAVDLSNVIGSATKGLFDSLAVSIQVDDNGMNLGNGGSNMANIVGGVLAGAGVATAVMYVQLSALLPILIGTLAAIVTVVIVLTMRQALIILLIVISPLAFVALLLPNTEGWFKKWRGLFFVMLLMFPAVAAIFGASALAGQIVMNSSPGNVLVQIMGAGITVIPLFITPVIMKAAGGVLNRFAGIVNNTDKGVFDRMRKGADGYRGYRKNINQEKRLGRTSKVLSGEGGALGGKNSRRRKFAAFVAGSGAASTVDTNQKRAYAEESAKEGAQEYFANRALEDPSFAAKIANNPNQVESLQASAQSALNKMEAETVNSREVLLRAEIDPRDLEGMKKKLNEALSGDKQDVATARAAQRILVNSGSAGVSALQETLSASEGGMSDDMSKALRKDINSSGLKGKDNALATWAYKDGKLADIAASADTYSGLNPTELAGQTMGNLNKAKESGAITDAMAKAVLNNQQASQLLDKNKRSMFEEIAKVSTQQVEQNSISIDHNPNIGRNPGSANTFPSGESRSDSGLVIPKPRDRN